jgi:prolycopene isomerase
MPGATLSKYQSRTLTQLLDEHLKDPVLKAYFSQLSAGIGAAPGQLSAVIAGVFFIHALRTQWMPRGGFSALASALADIVRENGGTILTEAEVTRIETRDGRASGVVTRDGQRFSTDAVVSNADARTTLLKMVEPEHIPAELRARLPKMALTPSIFQVHLGVDMDLEPYRQDLKRLNFVYPYPDIDRAMANFPNGNVEEAAFFLYVATFHQPEMAPPGKHSLKLEAYTTLGAKGIDWERDKAEIAKVFIRRAEKLIPGLGDHIVTQALRTPVDLQRDTGNSEGAFAGWAFTPELLSRQRPKQRTALPGLYLAGHWTTPTAGVPWVTVSGYNTAGMVIADRGKHKRR